MFSAPLSPFSSSYSSHVSPPPPASPIFIFLVCAVICLHALALLTSSYSKLILRTSFLPHALYESLEDGLVSFRIRSQNMCACSELAVFGRPQNMCPVSYGFCNCVVSGLYIYICERLNKTTETQNLG